MVLENVLDHLNTLVSVTNTSTNPLYFGMSKYKYL